MIEEEGELLNWWRDILDNFFLFEYKYVSD